VSADFREHTRARFVAPLLSHHDRRQFEVFCYSSVVRPDAVTASSRAAADCWREVRGMDDAALAELVRRDRIDVLVELTGHMGGNLLKLFARKPAPVQVAYPGYPATTALATIDALITDADRDPFDCAQDRRAGAKSLYTEPLVRLAVTSQCYRPPVDVPEVGDLPALRHGHVTFGVTNKLAKVTGATARCWSRIVAAVPGSRLLVITPGNPADQETVRSFFVGHGVPPERLDLVGRRQGRSYWELYGRIDIGLDTFPYNGHTTTLDGLWMGVPTVTLAGGAHVSREGLAVCRLMNLEDLVAWDEEHYKAITVRLVRHLPRLASLRYELRGRMAASPLRDEAGVTRRVESAYRRLWERWCGA
jgi:predicted O-linked N-acetylglucosamine transferase (SPINDLY family)